MTTMLTTARKATAALKRATVRAGMAVANAAACLVIAVVFTIYRKDDQ